MSRDLLQRAPNRVGRDERLVTLHVENRVERAKLRPSRNLGNAIGSGRVVGRGEHRLPARFDDAVMNLTAVGGDHDHIGEVERLNALQHANNERGAGEKSKGFPGESRRAQARWDDGEGSHERRGPRPDATFTPFNVLWGTPMRQWTYERLRFV